MQTMESLHFTKEWKSCELLDNLFVEQWIVPKGTKVKVKETRNFGWLVLPPDCKDMQGHIIPKRIFKY